MTSHSRPPEDVAIDPEKAATSNSAESNSSTIDMAPAVNKTPSADVHPESAAHEPVDEKQRFWNRNKRSTKLENEKEVDNPVGDEKKKDDHVKPVGMLTLFKYATRKELALNFIGLLCAIAAGAGQPLMTLFFGNITKAFTDFGTAATLISQGLGTDDVQAALDAAKADLKHQAGRMALWITVIGRRHELPC